jgi:hypothetical protein
MLTFFTAAQCSMFSSVYRALHAPVAVLQSMTMNAYFADKEQANSSTQRRHCLGVMVAATAHSACALCQAENCYCCCYVSVLLIMRRDVCSLVV